MNFIDRLDTEISRLIIGGILALGGGAVRVCGNPEHQQWKTIISSLMTAAFAGYLTAVIFHERISDLNYFVEQCPEDPISEVIRIQIHAIELKQVTLH